MKPYRKKIVFRIVLIFIIMAILVIISVSCRMKYFEKHKDEICSLCPDKVVTHTVDSVVYRNDTIYQLIYIDVELPKDTVVVTKYIHGGCVDVDTIYATNGLAKAKAWIKSNELSLMVYNVEKYQVIIDSLQTIVQAKDTYHSEKGTETIIVKKKYIPQWVWWLWGLSVILALFHKRILKMLV